MHYTTQPQMMDGLPLPTARDREALPHFLVISPPKTGSTWLAANLNCHPEIFVPDIKEVDFFNNYLTTKGWSWYADQLRPGLGLMRGEATPNYCWMPPANVRLARSVMPKLKLIYIIREPVSRAWSQARHCYRYQQTTFAGYRGPIDKVPDEKWIENLTHHTTMGAGRIADHLRCWLEHFPREQIFVDFYPSIRGEPTRLLGRLFKFLGVSAIHDFSFFQVSQKLNEGVSRRLPSALDERLRSLYSPGCAELATLLRDQFGLELPDEWQPLLQSNIASVKPVPIAAPLDCRANGDETIAAVPPSAPAPVVMPFQTFERQRLRIKNTPRQRDPDYFGYQLVYFKGLFFGIAHEVGFFDLRRMTEKAIVRLEAKGLLFRSPSLEWVKLQVTDKQLAPLYRPPGKPSIVFRAQRFCLRRLGAMATAITGKIQALSPRVAAMLKPTPTSAARRDSGT